MEEPENGDAGGGVGEGEEGGAGDLKAVVAGGPGSDLPPDAAVHLDVEQEDAGGLVLLQGATEVRSHRNGGAGEVRRPDVDVFVALVEGRDGSGHRNLLVLESKSKFA